MDSPSRRRTVSFASGREKSAYLDAMASLDARQPPVRAFAARIVCARGPNETEPIVRDFHRFVRDCIRYVHDPSAEEMADSATILNRGFDDCDGKSRLFVALCRAVGIPARIRPVFNAAGDFIHVQAETRWPGSERLPLAQPGGWLLAETTVQGCELGQDPASAPRDRNGRLRLT